ncbi:MAG: protein kinase [Planctomycetota bacterium]
MSEAIEGPNDRELPPAVKIDMICDRFESEWLAGNAPQIGDFLGEVEPGQRPRLFDELLQLDLEYRGKGSTGERRTLLEQFPEFRTEIEKAFKQQLDDTLAGTVNVDETQAMNSGESDSEDFDFDAISGRRLGGYELLGEIARGGMGVVFRARQIEANRIVAIKMILSGNLAGKDEIERFKTEAEAAAKLDHPNIVPIFDVGRQGNQHYFSMGLVEGPSFKQLIRDQAISRKEAAALIRELALAIHYAHENGVIHRDLKPANILLDSDRKPKITDFGLSKVLDRSTQLTGTGQLLGTPAYMSPEQASGDMSTVGPLSDVYSLGAILYELITGTLPFKSESIIEVLSKIRLEEPPAPRTISRDVDADIETICIKCLEKEPEQRYESARALADDLERYLLGEPVRARPIRRSQKIVRWCKRRPVIAGLAACLLASITLFGGSTTYFALISRSRGTQVEREREQANEMLDVAQLAIEQLVDQARMLADVPRTEATRKELLAKASDYYSRFLKQRPNDRALQRRTAILLRSIANVFRQLGEFEPALSAFDESIELLTTLASESTDAADTHELAESHIWRGVLLQSRDFEAALESVERAVELQQQLSNRSHDDASEYGLARALYNRGMLLFDHGDDASAERDYVAAIKRLRRILDQSENEGTAVFAREDLAEIRLDLARTLNNYGNLLKRTDRIPEAKAQITEAIALHQNRELTREEREDLAKFSNNLSNTLASLGELEQAAIENGLAIDLLERLVDEFPRYINLKSELSNAFNSQGALAGRQGDLELASKAFEKADAMILELVQSQPDDSGYANRHGNAKYNRALVLYMQKEYEDATEILGQAINLHATCLASNTKSEEFSSNLKKDYSLAIRLHSALNDAEGQIRLIDDYVRAFPDEPAACVRSAQWLLAASRSLEVADPPISTSLSSEELAERAVAQLRKAIELGQSTTSIIDGKTVVEVFQPLQDRPDFRNLISEIESRE